MRKKIAVLIPAHNEETVIGDTIQALLCILPAEDIFVVNDGSTDATEKIARRYSVNVLSLQTNLGKASAMNHAINYFHLADTYDFIMPMDADTLIAPDFLDIALPQLLRDTKKQIACVVGKVVGRQYSWVTMYRLWEYEVAQTVHKSAQDKENAVIVCPGCATIYRTEIFRKIHIPTGTVTEDMDFTFLIHRKKLGKITYVNNATVTTQDPKDLPDFLKQINRWYTGFWQCILKHNIPWGGQTLDAEVALLASEGLFNGLLVSALTLFVPITLIRSPALLTIPFGFDLCFFIIPTMAFTAWRYKIWKIFFYIPHFYFMRIISSLMFLSSFLKVILSIDLKMIWNKAMRYQIKEAL